MHVYILSFTFFNKGTYAIPKAQAEHEMKEGLAGGKGSPLAIKESSGKKSSPKHDIVEEVDDDEESMDWWTKYFASVDAMIEVYCSSSFSYPLVDIYFLYFEHPL